MSNYIVTVDDLREIQWYLNFRWAVKFDDAPAPFNKWFPATSVEENIVTLESYSSIAGVSSFSVPKNTTQFTLNMSIIDGGLPNNNLLTLHDWMIDWSNYIIDGDGFVRTISEVSRKVEVIKYNGQGIDFKKSSYMVFPEGQLNFVGSSESDTGNLDLTFIISAIL